jgi:hypothetical protein
MSSAFFSWHDLQSVAQGSADKRSMEIFLPQSVHRP